MLESCWTILIPHGNKGQLPMDPKIRVLPARGRRVLPLASIDGQSKLRVSLVPSCIANLARGTHTQRASHHSVGNVASRPLTSAYMGSKPCFLYLPVRALISRNPGSPSFTEHTSRCPRVFRACESESCSLRQHRIHVGAASPCGTPNRTGVRNEHQNLRVRVVEPLITTYCYRRAGKLRAHRNLCLWCPV